MPLKQLVLRDAAGFEHHTEFPLELITGTGADPRPRLRVDPEQTSFFEGREFRTYHEFNVPSGQSEWIRFMAPLDVIIHGRTLTVVQGNLRFALGTGGTPSGVWATKGILPVNAMSVRASPFYIGQVTSEFGGACTGLAERDVLVLETANNNALTATQTVAEAGLPANTYYAEFRNTGGTTLRGIYHVNWEEVQPRSPVLY